jgi:5-methylcytosine-specific restriction protein A
LLESRGFKDVIDHREKRGTAETQIVTARLADISSKMHVRLCWRRDGRHNNEGKYSAAQLRARLRGDDWDATLDFIAERAAANGVTHSLFVQDSAEGIEFAVLVPSDQVPAIWQRQRQVSAEIIAAGQNGRGAKNHAENGSSPTIWLQDDRKPSTPAVAAVLWNWPGIINVLALPANGDAVGDDSLDDLPIDAGLWGRDNGERYTAVRSGYRRDQKVRTAVIERANGKCERDACGANRPYSGFLDVHHILGVGISDRAWTCVALCPNCHREAHFAPDRDAINQSLSVFAKQFAE